MNLRKGVAHLWHKTKDSKRWTFPDLVERYKKIARLDRAYN